MALQFIFGPAGSGKSYTLYQDVIRESMEHPEQNFIVLVPEQFTMQTQKDLVSMHPRRGIMNIDVLSFARLSYRVFEETGGGSLPVLDDEGKNLILRKIAGDYEEELKVLRGNMKKLGCISEVKSVLSEFAQYDIGEEEILTVMESAGKESRLYYKLQDLLLSSGCFMPGSAGIRNVKKQYRGIGRIYRVYTGTEPAFAGTFKALPESLRDSYHG